MSGVVPLAIKIAGQIGGEHVHLRVFVGPRWGTLALAGTLTLRVEEWRLVAAVFHLGAERSMGLVEVEFEDPLTARDVLAAILGSDPGGGSER